MATQPPLTAGSAPAASATPFSWNIFANLARLSGMTAIQAVNWLDYHWYRLTSQAMIYAGAALIVGMVLNKLNLFLLNGWLGFGLVLCSTIVLLSTWFSASAIISAKLMSDAKITFKTYLQGVAHVMLFVGMVFLVLSMVKFHDFLWVGVLLLALTLFGYWSLAYMRGTGVYAKISLGIIILAMLVSAVKAVTFVSPQAAVLQSAAQTWESNLDEQEAARLEQLSSTRLARGSLTAAQQQEWNQLSAKERNAGFFAGVRARLETLGRVIQKDVRITTLSPQVLRGLDDLPTGCYTFQTAGPVVMAGNEPQWLHADLRLNGQRPGGRICKDTLSPPVLSFATGIPPNVALPQTITISFTWAP